MSQDKHSNNSSGNIPAYDILGTHYPYVNVNQGFLSRSLTDIRRSIASFNPFALRQVPSQERMGMGLRFGNHFYVPDIYPNGIHFTTMFPTHYDPLKELGRTEVGWQTHKHAPGPHSVLAITAEKLPRGCVRTISNYKRCEMVNGDDKCAEEKDEIINICPTWALDSLKEKQKFLAKVIAIQNVQYHKALEVSPYNKGRTVADVTDKTWIHGTRAYLRPDTMWADERYAKITQSEINDAKKRIAERRAHAKSHDHHGHDHEHHHGGHHYDFKHAEVKTEKPLYP